MPCSLKTRQIHRVCSLHRHQVIAQQPGQCPRDTHGDAAAAEVVVFRMRCCAAHHLLLVQVADVDHRLAVQHALDPVAPSAALRAGSTVVAETGRRRPADAHQSILGVVGQGVDAPANRAHGATCPPGV